MTYDEIMALSGRELDAAVAEHVYSLEILWSDYRAAVYVATRPQWMGSNDSNQCESDDDAEECDA